MMNNMYDILAKLNSVGKQNLTEGKRPDFLDLDRDGDKKEPMSQAARQAKDKKQVDETSMDESALQAYLGKKKYGQEGMKALQKAGREGAGKEKMASIRSKYDKMDEAEVGEGNDFTGARLAAIKAGKPTFQVDGKTYRVTGDTSDEKVMEKTVWPGTKEYKTRYPDDMRTGEKRRSSTGGEIERTATGVKHTAKAYDDEEDTLAADDGAPKKKGRPKGSKRALGAKVKGTSKLHMKGAIKETDLEEDYDQDEYDEEGEMAKSQSRTIADAAEELQNMLGDNENLPEWVQKKITLAQEYIDSARDYLAANRPESEVMAEKAVSKAQRAAAGIARAAQKGEIPKSELRGASKEMAKMPAGELKKFAKTKEKGLPEKVKEEDKEEVEETTVAGSVAPAAEAPKGKKGMIFGKGVYESQIAESFEKKLTKVLTEGISINASQGEDGKKTLTVNATDDDAVKLGQLLQLAGMPQGSGYQDACPSCGGMHEGECLEETDLANSPDEQTMDTDMMINTMSGGLNGRKTTGQTTGAPFNAQPARQGALHGKMEEVVESNEGRLWKLYQRYETRK
jgi:hypothetical protein